MLYCYCVTFSSSTQFHNQGESSCLVGEGAVAQGTGTARGRELLQLQGSTVGCVHGGLVAHPARPGLVAGAAAKRDQSRKPSFLVVLTSFYQPSLSRFHPLEEYFKLLWLAYLFSSSLREVAVSVSQAHRQGCISWSLQCSGVVGRNIKNTCVMKHRAQLCYLRRDYY